MTLDIAEQDLPVLQSTLEIYSRQLLEEIAAAEVRDYRERLKERYEKLEQLRLHLATNTHRYSSDPSA